MTVDPSHPRPPEEGQPGYPSSTHTPPPPAYVAHDEPRKPADGPLVGGSGTEDSHGAGGSNVNRWLVISLVIVSLIAIGLLIFTFTRDTGDTGASEAPSDPATSSESENLSDGADPDEQGEGEGDGSEENNPGGDQGTAGANGETHSGDGSGDGQGSGQADGQADVTELAKALPSRDPDIFWAEGRIDAPVVITEFADFRCIHCAHWFFDVHPKLKPMIDSGKLRVEARSIPLFGAESVPAVVAAWVAGEQGKYFEYAKELFQATVDHNTEVYSQQGLKDLAEKVGLDKAKFSAQFDTIIDDLSTIQESQPDDLSADTKAMMDLIEENFRSFQELGFSGTPAFVIGEQLVKGALPWEQFEQVINQELNK